MGILDGFRRFKPKAEPTRKPRTSSNWDIPEDERKKALAMTVPYETALKAKEILENEAMATVLGHLKSDAMLEWAGAPTGIEGLTERETAHLKVRALDEIESKIRALADELKLHKPRDAA